MSIKCRFTIDNRTSRAMQLQIEPEAARFCLQPGQQVDVSDDYIKLPLSLAFDDSGDGEVIVSIWPGDGDVVVRQSEKDVLDLVQQAATSSTKHAS